MSEIPELDPKGLRDFGLLAAAVVGIMFGLFLPWLRESSFPAWPWSIAGALAVWAAAAPLTLKPSYRLWMKLGLLLGRITTPVILALVFFLVVVPMAIGMRIMGRDPMARQIDRNAETYRVISHKAARKKMERPF